MILLAIGPAVLLLLPVGGLIAAGVWFFKKKPTSDPGKKLPGGGGKVPGNGGKVPGGGQVVPPAAPMPFAVSVSSDGVVNLKVDSAFELYRWATELAPQNGIDQSTNAEDALRSLAASLPGGRGNELTQITFTELSLPVQWTDILADAAPMTYGEMLVKVEQGMQDRGLA